MNEIGEFENTYIFFTSDHGDLFGDHGLYQLYLLRSERSDIQAAITVLREQKETLEVEKNKLTTDSKYIEQLARERFRMAKKGEKIVKVIEKKPE